MQGPALKEAVERHRDMVFRIAYTYLRNAADADDVTQDAFVKLLRSTKPFEGDEHLRNWLIRVTVNECKSLFRSPWRSVEDVERYVRSLEAKTNEHADLLVDVMCLPEKYRIVLVFHYYLGLSSDEIAGILRVPAATVRTRLARGRARLKCVLEDEEHVE